MKDSFIEPLALPDMQAEILDPAGLERFFAAVAFETSVRGVLLRGESLERRASDTVTLRAARDAFLQGQATGLQIHYVHDSVEWWDTLMHTEGGIRRVRVRKAGNAP